MKLKIDFISKFNNVIISASLLCGFAVQFTDTIQIASGFFLVLSAIATSVWLYKLNSNPEIYCRIEFKIVVFIAFLLFAYLLLSIFASIFERSINYQGATNDVSSTIVETIKLLGILSIFFLGYSIGTDTKVGNQLIDFLIYSVGIWAVCAIYLFSIDKVGVYGYASIIPNRLRGAFSSPNSAGTLFGGISVALMVLISAFAFRKKYLTIVDRIPIIFSILFLLNFYTLFLTQSRAAFVATLLSILITLIFLYMKNLKENFFILIISMIIFLFIPIILAIFSGQFTRFYNLDFDLVNRNFVYATHFEVFKNNLLFGTGLGTFVTENLKLLDLGNYQNLYMLNSVHNLYLQWLEETGIIGFSLITLFNLFIVGFCLRKYNYNSENIRVISVLGFYLVFIIHSVFDYAAQEPIIASFLALLMGIIFAISGNNKSIDKVKLY